MMFFGIFRGDFGDHNYFRHTQLIDVKERRGISRWITYACRGGRKLNKSKCRWKQIERK